MATENDNVNSNQSIALDYNLRPIKRTSLTFRDIKMCNKYLGTNETSDSILGILRADGGIVLEYSPEINITTSASYSTSDITHSNYDYNTFIKSAITQITVDIKMVSDTLDNADKTLAVIHLLRSLTKMSYGANDPEAGMPPPIMLLSAYGDYMVNDMPVAIRTFYIQLNSDVDYVHTRHNTQVPIEFNIQLDMVHMPNPKKVRDEFSIERFINGDLVKGGYF